MNWQPRNIAKAPGEMARNSLAHFARGADGDRCSSSGAPRGPARRSSTPRCCRTRGTDTRIWREVVELGAALRALAPVAAVAGGAGVAIVWDWEAWWALELDWRPSQDVRYVEQVTHWYEQLWRSRLTADFVRADADLSRYPLVVVPSLYLTTRGGGEELRGYAEAGGTLVVSFFSGIVDENDAVVLGGYPGALRDLLGIVVDEFLPLRVGETVRLSDGASADLWADDIRLRGAEAVTEYADGPAAGKPAVTRHAVGAGEAWYVSTRLAGADLRALLARIPAARSEFAAAPETVEVVTRRGADADYVTVINHGEAEATVAVAGYELLTATETETLVVPGGEVRVVRRRG